MSEEHPYIHVCTENGGTHFVEMDGKSPIGCSRRIDNVLEHLTDRLRLLEKHLQETINAQIQAKKDLEKGNPHFEEITTLKKKLAEIDKQLNESENENESEDKAS